MRGYILNLHNWWGGFVCIENNKTCNLICKIPVLKQENKNRLNKKGCILRCCNNWRIFTDHSSPLVNKSNTAT